MGNSVCCVGNGGPASSGDDEPLCCISPHLQFRLKRINCRPTYRRSSQDVIVSSPDHDDLSHTQTASDALLMGQDDIVPPISMIQSQVTGAPVLGGITEIVEEMKTLKVRSPMTLPLKLKNLIAAPSSIGNGSLLPIVVDGDFCPTCLDGYDSDNPKIVTQCKHHYHLPCILEWLERSKACPMCNQEMVFNEQS